MPTDPTPAQSEASRLNGALSGGPVTEAGKARSSRNAVKHNLFGPFCLLPAEEADAFDHLMIELTRRLEPVGEVETHWVEEIAFALWRLRRLRGVEVAAASPQPVEPEDSRTRPPPSLATLISYRARIERDLRLAQNSLAVAQSAHPRLRAAPTLVQPCENTAAPSPLAAPQPAGLLSAGQPTSEIDLTMIRALLAARTKEPEQPPALALALERRERRRQKAMQRQHR